MTDYNDLLISDQNFFVVLPEYNRFHFNTYPELVEYCETNDMVIDDLDIRLGYDSKLTVNTFVFYDQQDFINGELINKVERNQFKTAINKVFNGL